MTLLLIAAYLIIALITSTFCWSYYSYKYPNLSFNENWGSPEMKAFWMPVLFIIWPIWIPLLALSGIILSTFYIIDKLNAMWTWILKEKNNPRTNV